MKVEITANGEVRIFLVPEGPIDDAVLEELSKMPIEMIHLNKQVQVLDKQFAKGAIIQVRRKREGDVPSISTDV